MNGQQSIDSFFRSLSLGEDSSLEDFLTINRLDFIHLKTKGSIFFRRLIVKNDFNIISASIGGNLVFEHIEATGSLYLCDVQIAGDLVLSESFLRNSLILSGITVFGDISIIKTKTENISFGIRFESSEAKVPEKYFL